MATFADLSHHQAAVDLAAYARTHDRVVLKATEGTGFLDPLFTTRWRQAGQLGLARVAYHYARTEFTGASEFAWFLSRVQAAGGLGPRDWLCLDAEDTRTPAGARQQATEFTAAAVAAGHPNGLVYTGVWYANPNRLTPDAFAPGWRRLWLSDYTTGQPDAAIEVPAGWSRGHIVARQYTDRMIGVGGISTACDYNRVMLDWIDQTQESGDDMSAEDVAAINKETDRLVDAAFAALTTGRRLDGTVISPGHQARSLEGILGKVNDAVQAATSALAQATAARAEAAAARAEAAAARAAVESLPTSGGGTGSSPTSGDLTGTVTVHLTPLPEPR